MQHVHSYYGNGCVHDRVRPGYANVHVLFHRANVLRRHVSGRDGPNLVYYKIRRGG